MQVTIEAAISDERFERYLISGGFDRDRALRLYVWNLRISASFVPPIAAVEVTLRNLVAAQLANIFGTSWWHETAFHETIGKRGKGIVKRAEEELAKRGTIVTHGRFLAEMSYGFWSNMLLEKYEETLWTDLHRRFPDLPSEVDRSILHAQCEALRDLRNRITHHEPLLGRDLSREYSDGLKLLSWLSRAKCEWLRPHLTVMAELRRRP